MHGRHYDVRVQKHLTPFYSRVSYLDTVIFNIQQTRLRQSRRARDRTTKALKAIERTRLKSQMLEQGLTLSRIRQKCQDQKYIQELHVSQKFCEQKQKEQILNFTAQKRQSRINTLSDQKYLQNILASNSTKAASRLMSVRRWT